MRDKIQFSYWTLKVIGSGILLLALLLFGAGAYFLAVGIKDPTTFNILGASIQSSSLGFLIIFLAVVLAIPALSRLLDTAKTFGRQMSGEYIVGLRSRRELNSSRAFDSVLVTYARKRYKDLVVLADKGEAEEIVTSYTDSSGKRRKQAVTILVEHASPPDGAIEISAGDPEEGEFKSLFIEPPKAT